MKHLIYCVAIVIAGLIGYYCGTQTWYTDVTTMQVHHYNTEESRLAEVKYCNAALEALHWYYRNDTIFWNEFFKITDEYKNLEVANNGDWEDFYSPNWK